MPRVKICYKCKEYVRLFPENPDAVHQEIGFGTFHSRHPVQIVGEVEFRSLNKQEYTEFKIIFEDAKNG